MYTRDKDGMIRGCLDERFLCIFYMGNN